MATPLGRATDAVSFVEALAAAPYRYDFYQTLRRLECLHPGQPRWGCALRPIDEAVRLGQDPDLSFAPASLASFEIGRDGRPSRLQVRLFGLLGPNGPLPIHITEYARLRLRHAGDPTFSRFLDLLNHRFLALFYRAWAQAQPHVNRDRPSQDRFAIYVGAFVGIAPAASRNRDSLPDLAKLFHASTLVRQVRNTEGLTAILQQFFRVPVRIEEFVGQWLRLGPKERSYLGRDGATLGTSAVMGASVWDHQHKFRIHLGPLTLAQYEGFLPASSTARAGDGTGLRLRQLVDWVRTYLCFELDWDVCLRLQEREVPKLTLGRRAQLGWTTWLGNRKAGSDADDLFLDAEMRVHPDRAAA